MPQTNVQQLPLSALWRDGALLQALKGDRLGENAIRAALRDSTSSIVIADVGRPLEWVAGLDRYNVWKQELSPHLVPPETDRFTLDDFPGGYCYTATKWTLSNQETVIVFETHH